MGVLVINVADHLAERKEKHEVAVTVGPIGHGQAGVVAGDQPADGQQPAGRQQRQYGETKSPIRLDGLSERTAHRPTGQTEQRGRQQ